MPDPEPVFMVRYIGGQSYQGFDPGLLRHVEVQNMELTTVSPAKRDQLLTDFPGDWEDFGLSSPTAAGGEAENVLPTPLQPRRRGPGRKKPAEPTNTK